MYTVFTLIQNKEIQIGKAKIVYKTAGDAAKETAIFLHGWPGTLFAKSGVLDELAKDYFVIAPEHPGYLHSEPLEEYHNILNQYADVVFAILAAEGKEKEKVTIIGQSFGATVASNFVSRYETNTKIVVFCSSFMCTKRQDILRKILWNHGGLIIRSFLYLPNFLKKKGLMAFFGVSTNADSRINNALIRARVELIDNSTGMFSRSMKSNGNLLDRVYGDFPIIFCWGDKDGEEFNVHGYSAMTEGQELIEKLKTQGKRVELMALRGGHTIIYEKPEYAMGHIREAIRKLVAE